VRHPDKRKDFGYSRHELSATAKASGAARHKLRRPAPRSASIS